jgi:hypothetical protein
MWYSDAEDPTTHNSRFSDEGIRANNMVGACPFAFFQGRLVCGGSWSGPSWRT